MSTTEKAASQSHFIDLFRMLGEPTPLEADPTGEHYALYVQLMKYEDDLGNPPLLVVSDLDRILLCLFAEDAGLLPKGHPPAAERGLEGPWASCSRRWPPTAARSPPRRSTGSTATAYQLELSNPNCAKVSGGAWSTLPS